MFGITLNAVVGDNGIVTKAQEASFRTEMATVREKVDLALVGEGQQYKKPASTVFHPVTLEEAKKWDNYLKFEVIYWGKYDLDYGVTKLTRNYIKKNGDPILEKNVTTGEDGVSYIKNLYFVNKEIVDGKEKAYLYDDRVDQVYKVNLTNIGKYKVHSIEELDYLLGNGTGQREIREGSLIEGESNLATVGSIVCYEPDLKGFIKEKTSALYYTTNAEGSLNEEAELVPISDYLNSKNRTIEKDGKEYEFYNYEKQIWANIKIEEGGIETYWVWIPRYAYNISGLETRVIFLDKDGNPKDGSTLPSNYVPHPAFEGKSGIWASKYEVTKED